MSSVNSVITDTIVRVLNRPRFGITVLDSRKVEVASRTHFRTETNFTRDGYHYTMTIDTFMKSTNLIVRIGNDTFFTKMFKNDKLPVLRLVGVTLANKAKMRIFHDISEG